jgi:chemotaxis protein histidine kinase CheA
VIDPEILEGFNEETRVLLKELADVVEQLESFSGGEFPKNLLNEFAQKIDRIMGAAKTIETIAGQNPVLNRIGKLCELSKKLGYTAAEKGNLALIPIFAGFWADMLDVIDQLLNEIGSEDGGAAADKKLSLSIQKRLKWLGDRVGLSEEFLSSIGT